MNLQAAANRHLSAAILLSACCLLYLLGSAQLPFLGPDEPRYSQVARQMLDSGDYMTPHLGQSIWFEKPILLYWLMTICYTLFGVNEFAARLPSALAALGTVAVLYFTVLRMADRRAALLAAVTCGTNAFFVGFAHAATFDMLLTFCVSSALCCFVLFERESRRLYLYLMYVAAGLGVLAKGFVALIIIGIAIFAYLLIARKLRQLPALKPLTGILIIAAVTSIWFVPVSLQHGLRFWDEFFYQHHVMRYTSSHYHRSGSIFYYVPVLILGTFPWTFAPLVSPGEASNQAVRRFALCWFAGTVLFFSLSQSKLPGYVLPAIPAFALLSGLSLAEMPEAGRQRIAWVLVAPLNSGVLLAVYFGARFFKVSFTPLAVWIVVTVIIVCASWLLFHRKNYATAVAIYCLIPVSAVLFFLFGIFPQLNFQESKTLMSELKELAPDDQKLVVYNVYDFGPVFYLNGAVELTPEGYLYTIEDYRQMHRYVQSKHQAWVLAGNEELEWMKSADFWTVGRVIPGKERSVVHLIRRR